MLIACVIILLAIFVLILSVIPLQHVNVRWKTLRAISKLPGPSGIPILGMGYFIATLTDEELLDTLKDFYKKFSPVVASYVAGIPFVIIKTPESIEALLGSINHISKGYEYDPIRSWLQDGLLVSSGKKWHQRRKLLTPAFHFRILEDNLQSLNKHARYLLRNMLRNEGKPFVAEQLVTLCTLDVICETAMGFSLNMQDNQESEYLKNVKSASALVVLKILKFWLRSEWVFHLTSYGKQFKKSLSLLHNFSEKIIKERKVSYNQENIKKENVEEDAFSMKQRKAFLDSLLELDKKYPNLLTDLDIREEVDTFMFEGHDTTSAAIIFSLYLLGSHPEIQEKAHQELYQIFGDSDRAVTSKDLHEMNYLDLVIKEALRMFPSVPYFSRELTQDLILPDGLVLPEGTSTVVLPYLLHRDPEYFPEPDVFNPERFTQENCKKRHPFSYIPFSAGPRNCIGQKFAMMELKVVLSTVIRFLKIESVTKKEEFKLLPYLILRSDPPIQIKALPRNESNESNFEMIA